jgi:hypothetical protein
MDWNFLLFIVSAVAGLVLTVGSLFLLWKGRIMLDSNGKPTEMQLPLNLTIKTQTPVLIMFLLGAFLIFLPQYYKAKECIDLNVHKSRPLVKLTGEVVSDENMEVYAIVDAQKANTDTKVELTVPYLEDRRYYVLYVRGDGKVEKEYHFKLANDQREHHLEKVLASQTLVAANADIAPAQTVSSSVEANYK